MECPKCSAPGSDIVAQPVMVADPVGSHSLPGQQVKFSAHDAYRLTCRQCSWTVVGEVHGGYLVPIGTSGEDHETADSPPES
jgi:hypothetical protein